MPDVPRWLRMLQIGLLIIAVFCIFMTGIRLGGTLSDKPTNFQINLSFGLKTVPVSK